MRILVAIAPLMYRQALARSLGQRDPAPEILLSTPEELDREVERFRPQLLICHEGPEWGYSFVPARVVIPYANSLKSYISLGRKETMIEDISMEEMLKIVDEAKWIAGAS